MPWWLWLFIVYWFVAGLISAWYWWDLGSLREFAFYFMLGFAITPVTADHLLDQEGLGDRQGDLKGRQGEKKATEISRCSLGPAPAEKTLCHSAIRLAHPKSANQRTKEGRGVFISRNVIFISY